LKILNSPNLTNILEDPVASILGVEDAGRRFPPEHYYASPKLHGARCQKTIALMITSAKISNPTKQYMCHKYPHV
jgi:hypothetical protein